MERNIIEQLVTQTKSGSETAFAALYDEFADRLYRFIRFKINDDVQAEDILQEVFVKAWHGCKTLQIENLNFSAWLYTIATNTVNDHFRKIYRRPQTVALDATVDIASSHDTTKTMSDLFDAAQLQNLLQSIPAHYKQVLELRFIQEFSIDETARIMKKTSIAVRVLQHRAIKHLQNNLRNHETA